MTDELYEKLAAPFAQTFKKPSSNLDYITGEQVTSRLNEVLGWSNWSFHVIEHGYNEEADELWCRGRLVVKTGDAFGHTEREQFGSQKPNRYSRSDNAGKIIDLGFDLKGAATDALKKCASLIGVGLYLHEKDAPHGAERQAPVSASAGGTSPAQATPAAPPAAAVTTQPPAAVPPNPAPPKGMSGFWQYVLQEMKYNRDSVTALCQQWYGNREPKDLKESELKELIVRLEDQKKKEPAA